MPMPYLNLWDTKEEMIAAWEGSYGTPTPEQVSKYSHVEVLLASYVQPSYDGYAFVLFRDTRDGLIYENHGSHCSCYGLEDQWGPELTDLDALMHRVENGNLGESQDGEPGFGEQLKMIIHQLRGTAPPEPVVEMIRWIRIPGPGQFRGEGTWKDFDEVWPDHDDHWVDLQNTKYLPTKELPKGVDPNA